MKAPTHNLGSPMSPFGLSLHLIAHRSAFLKRLRALMGICALILQMLAPVAAHSANSGEWMVICGADGPVLMQVQLSDDAPAPCPKCDDCKACQLSVSVGGVLSAPLTLRDLLAMTAEHRPLGVSIAANPAQFWHENRGPPLVQSLISDSLFRLSHAATLSQGDAPWT